MRALLLLGTLVLAGLTGAALTLAGVESPATGSLTLLFVLFTPALGVAMLMTGLDLLARAIVAGAASVALAASVAEVMLVTSSWSPRGGLIAIMIACVGLAIAALVLRPRPPAADDETIPIPVVGDGRAG
ncbi:hypothetical protein GCM10027176_59080 [Actinoallomurus bryophytorum]|uniref:Uncharacterized protein n=2 Tax=Actinoallomurus bryophytorum TaxID=1490222 RepID=A0A543CH27_9ACTN|nr:hypothetical protein FB559_1923 [Actinoallomurus bryophytorum]